MQIVPLKSDGVWSIKRDGRVIGHVTQEVGPSTRRTKHPGWRFRFRPRDPSKGESLAYATLEACVAAIEK